MAVEDDELLALAGGDSSDEEEIPQQPSTNRNANSPLPSIEVSQAPNSKPAGSKPRASPAFRGGSSTKTKKSRRNDSEEEGEASSDAGSPDSLQSAPMSESDSELSAAADGLSDDNPFPLEGKFLSEGDRKKLLALPEIERESILAEREHIKERKKQDQQLRTLLKAKLEGESKPSKRKADPDLEESPRKSTRQKTTLGGRKVGEASKTIEAYKRQREEKGLKTQQRKAGALATQERRARSSSNGRYPSADADGESEVEWDTGKSKADEERFRNAQPADFNDFRRTTLTRNFLAEFCFHPGFAEKIRECYVRLPQKSAPGIPSNGYQLVQIKNVFDKEGWPYAMMKNSGKRFVTNQHLMLAVEGTQKEFHMNSISNSTVTEVEVANHKNNLANEGKPIPSRPYLDHKIDDINSLIHHQFTDDELQHKLERSGVLSSKAASFEKVAILNRRRAAEEHADEAAVAKCDAELTELTGPRLRYGTSLDNPKPVVAAPALPSQQDLMAELNRQNRKKNAEDIRKAQLAEKRAARLAREAVARGEAVEDPFARVKTTARTHYDVNETLAPHRVKEVNRSRSGTPAGLLTPKIEARKVTRSPEVKPQSVVRKGLPVLGSRNMDDEIIGALDMGIDIEI
ncbi:uncharacterized protein KY384_006087 [Bacidia gigantensis]|uniref:uncharacterized protein n=1 Tax=Bacidia gigantensis TaxID=2732470 RepID=UPI001D043954|nr:uncharacterized protein KY384_006087 [Bacidia gigantensis]KAG8529450.1 hypothetical protein KY384_006087 [Bacidia gigantensis]